MALWPTHGLKICQGHDAIIQAAVYGSNSPFGTSDSETVIENIVAAAKQVQSSDSRTAPLRVWVLSGQVLLDIPGANGKIEGDIFPIHPEHYKNYAYLQKEGDELDWSVLCPGKILEGEVRSLHTCYSDREMCLVHPAAGKPAGPLIRSIDRVGIWYAPGIIGSIPFIGALGRLCGYGGPLC